MRVPPMEKNVAPVLHVCNFKCTPVSGGANRLAEVAPAGDATDKPRIVSPGVLQRERERS